MSATAFALPPRDARADRPTPGIALTANLVGQDALLPPGALALLVSLHRAIEPARQARLAARRERQAFFDAGGLPDFRADTAHIREGHWKVAPIPRALQDRRVPGLRWSTCMAAGSGWAHAVAQNTPCGCWRSTAARRYSVWSTVSHRSTAFHAPPTTHGTHSAGCTAMRQSLMLTARAF